MSAGSIVKRLRDSDGYTYLEADGRRLGLKADTSLMREAAAVIERQAAEVERLTAVIRQAVTELAAEHAEPRPESVQGCRLCWPGDGSWPCVTRMIADELRAAIGDDQ